MINRQNSQWSLAGRPDLDWSAGAPRSREVGDIYYSVDDGLAETQYVFIEGNDLSDRFSQLQPGQSFTVAETGFGTGLNFLVTLDLWQRQRPKHARLHYIGIDHRPLRRADLQRAMSIHPSLRTNGQRLLDNWPIPLLGCHRITLPEQGVTLDLWWDDAHNALSDLSSRNQRWVDAWFLDGFAPSRDEGIWSQAIFDGMAAISKANASFATFTAAGNVRRGLQTAGFTVSKRPGFGKKRECLIGRIENTSPKPMTITPWDLNPHPRRPGSVLVIGAGLAGSHVARSLAERGIPVTVLEQAGIAQGGSSNLQGLTYTRLSHRCSPLSDYALLSYAHAVRHYAELVRQERLGPDDAQQCGFFQTVAKQDALDKIAALLDEQTPAKALNAQQASDLLGVACPNGGLYYPDAFWLHPPAVCRERLAHPLIRVIEQTGPTTLVMQADGWTAHAANGGDYKAEVAVLATAYALKTVAGQEWLPLQGIRGQTSHVAATTESAKLTVAFCHEGYLPPARLGWHCLGASYGPNDLSLDERSDDHNHNLKSLAAALPGLGFPIESSSVSGHVALRCTSADYLPIVGPLPERATYNATYMDLTRQKTRLIPAPCPTVPGLWTLAALGSRGLTAAPLAAEALVSDMLGESPPLPRYLWQALVPSRFLTRALIRGNPL